MLLVLGAVVVSFAMVFIHRMWPPSGVSTDSLGWMSEQWLDEYRASHPA
jgi:hypothetical protein